MTSHYGRKGRRTKEPLDESERGEEKAGLKFSIQKTNIIASGPITSRQIDGEKIGNHVRPYFFDLQNRGWWLQSCD